MTGWCPIHDRVYEAEDGLCPQCGTALVTDDAPAQKAIVIEPTTDPGAAESTLSPSGRRDARRTSTLVGIAAAIVIAFVAGLSFPRAKPETTGSTVRQATSDLTIGVTRNAAGLPIRLESFTQRGREVIARFTVGEEADVDLGRIRTAGVSFIIGSGGEISSEMFVRPTITGFILQGEVLQSDTTPVLGIRIEELIVTVGSGADIAIDLTGAWPATLASQPRARRASGSLEPGDGRTFRIFGYVGWADHVDIGVSIVGARPDWEYASEFQLIADGLYDGALSSATGTSTIRFDSLPRNQRKYSLRISARSMLAHGPWEWSFV